MEIENNSLLDYNTNSGNTEPPKGQPPAVEQVFETSYSKMSDINDKGETIISLTFNMSSNHPILKKKTIFEEISKGTECKIYFE